MDSSVHARLAAWVVDNQESRRTFALLTRQQSNMLPIGSFELLALESGFGVASASLVPGSFFRGRAGFYANDDTLWVRPEQPLQDNRRPKTLTCSAPGIIHAPMAGVFAIRRQGDMYDVLINDIVVFSVERKELFPQPPNPPRLVLEQESQRLPKDGSTIEYGPVEQHAPLFTARPGVRYFKAMFEEDGVTPQLVPQHKLCVGSPYEIVLEHLMEAHMRLEATEEVVDAPPTMLAFPLKVARYLAASPEYATADEPYRRWAQQVFAERDHLSFRSAIGGRVAQLVPGGVVFDRGRQDIPTIATPAVQATQHVEPGSIIATLQLKGEDDAATAANFEKLRAASQADKQLIQAAVLMEAAEAVNESTVLLPQYLVQKVAHHCRHRKGKPELLVDVRRTEECSVTLLDGTQTDMRAFMFAPTSSFKIGDLIVDLRSTRPRVARHADRRHRGAMVRS